jgi:hypothetical protein
MDFNLGAFNTKIFLEKHFQWHITLQFDPFVDYICDQKLNCQFYSLQFS